MTGDNEGAGGPMTVTTIAWRRLDLEGVEWVFTVHDRATGAPVLKSDDRPLTISRLTSPATGPRTRTRRFIHALLSQELSKDQLKSLLHSGTLAGRLKNRTAICFIAFEEAQDGVRYPRINELQPVDNGKSPPPSPPSPPTSPPRAYEEIFGNDDTGADNSAASGPDLPF